MLNSVPVAWSQQIALPAFALLMSDALIDPLHDFERRLHRRQLRAWRTSPRVRWSALAATLAVILLVLLALAGNWTNRLIDLLQQRPGFGFSVTLAAAWLTMRSGLRQARAEREASWLRAAPIDERHWRRATRRRIARRFLPLVAVMALLALASWMKSGDAAAFAAPMWMLGGLLAGASVARVLPLPPMASSALPRLGALASATPHASLAPLSRWPFARLRADADPRSHALLTAALLLSAPMGTPPRIALLALALLAALVFFTSLVRAASHALHDAKRWLHVTPLAGGMRRSQIMRHALPALAMVVFVGCILALALGAPLHTVAAIASAACLIGAARIVVGDVR